MCYNQLYKSKKILLKRIRSNKCFKILPFDLDGTLTNSAEGITKCVQYALRAQNIEEPDLKKLEVFYRPGPLRDSFIKHYGMTREQAEIGVENIVNATPISVLGEQGLSRYYGIIG